MPSSFLSLFLTTTTLTALCMAFRPTIHLNRKFHHRRRHRHPSRIISTTSEGSFSSTSRISTAYTTRIYSTPPFDGGIPLFMNSNDGDEDDDSDSEEIIFVVYDPADDQIEESLLEEDEDIDEEEDEEEDDPYTKVASSEFQDDEKNNKRRPRKDIGALTLLGKDELDTTLMDWGGALSTLRERVQDFESGKSQDPSHVLFRLMSNQTPNQIIGQFVSSANPMVVQAMSGAVGSLLGGLSNPAMGVETIVKASGEKIGSLCFQLQMTGKQKVNTDVIYYDHSLILADKNTDKHLLFSSV
jgi:hypothetical protein